MFLGSVCKPSDGRARSMRIRSAGKERSGPGVFLFLSDVYSILYLVVNRFPRRRLSCLPAAPRSGQRLVRDANLTGGSSPPTRWGQSICWTRLGTKRGAQKVHSEAHPQADERATHLCRETAFWASPSPAGIEPVLPPWQSQVGDFDLIGLLLASSVTVRIPFQGDFVDLMTPPHFTA